MLKRLITIVLVISVVAIFWPYAKAQAACGWVKVAGGWCYLCPLPNTSLSGAAVDPSQCIYWYPGSAISSIILKQIEISEECKKDGINCPTAVSAVFGTQDKKGNPVNYPLDYEAYVPMWVFCCPPGHTDPLTGECLDPVYSSGNPGTTIGGEIGAAQFTEVNKRVSKEEIEISFPSLCPNESWYEESYPIDFNGLTCVCQGSWDKDGDDWKCCYARNEDTGVCTSYNPPPGEPTVDETAMILRCKEEEPYTWDAFDNCDLVAPTDGFTVPPGFCDELFGKYMNSN